MNRIGFKNMLLIVVTSLLVIALAIISYIAIDKFEESKKSSLITNMIEVSESDASHIQSYISKYSQPLVDLAALYRKRNYTRDHEIHMEVAARAAGITKLTLGFEDGRSYTSKPSNKTFPGGVGIPSKYDPRTRDWYKLGKESSGLALSDVFATKKGELLLLAVHPIDGGVLASDVRLAHLQMLIEPVEAIADEKSAVAANADADAVELIEEAYTGSFTMIVDQNGMVLASTGVIATAQDNINEIEGLSDFAGHMVKQTSLVEDLTMKNIESVVVATRIELEGSEPWYLLIAVDKKTAFAPVYEASWQLLILVTIISLFFVVILIVLLNRIYRPVIALKELVLNLSSGSGDLTQRLTVSSADDLGQIAVAINSFIESLQLMLLDVKRVSGRLSEGVTELKTHSDQSASILGKHQQETDQVVTAVEELSVTAELVAENAQETAVFTQEANSSGETSKQTIIDAQQSLQRLSHEVEGATTTVTTMSQETQDIASILNIIGAIAEQTNLLALNAAIEAARAGEQGRGFAVVADEVRALAGRTQASTAEIEVALDKLQHGSVSVVNSIKSTSNTSQQTVSEAAAVAASLETMTGFVEKINDLSTQIASSAQEQNVVIREISENMSRIHSMAQELTVTGSDVNQETNNIQEVNGELNTIIGDFILE